MENMTLLQIKILGVLRCLHDLRDWGYIKGQGTRELSLKGLGLTDAIELEEIDNKEMEGLLTLISNPTPVLREFVKDFTILYKSYREAKFPEQQEI